MTFHLYFMAVEVEPFLTENNVVMDGMYQYPDDVTYGNSVCMT